MILVLGKFGQVATELRKLANDNFFFSSREDINLLEPEKIQDFLTNFDPRLIINCTAYNKVDEAELDSREACLINSESIKMIAVYAQKKSCPVIHISTDFVFDGALNIYDESSTKNPLNVYGKTKSDGEEHLLKRVNKLLILRTSWVYSNIGANFFNSVKNNFLDGKELYGAADILGSPTRALTIARFIDSQYQNFLDYDFKKIYNICDSGSVSRYGFVSRIMQELSQHHHVPMTEVHSVQNKFFKLLATRPMQSILDNRNIKKDFVFDINDWQYELSKEVQRSYQ